MALERHTRNVATIMLSLAVALVAPACGKAGPQPMLDRSSLALTFEETFDRAPRFRDAGKEPEGRWKTNFFFGVQDPDHPMAWTSRTIAGNGELQYYASPFAMPSPFEWKDGILSIVARRTPMEGRSRAHGLPYLSGLITTEKSFSQAGGYFEARIALPHGRGLWPAFWLLPDPKIENGNPVHPGGQEIDVFESIGEPGTLYQTVFTDRDGAKVKDAQKFETSADLRAFHTYGVLVTKANIVWYFDDVEVRRVMNTDFVRPAYLLLNLAVGGNWPGAPDDRTHFPAVMRIDWVRAYRLGGKAQ